MSEPTANNILWSFSRDVVKWVLLASLIAWPLAYYFMTHWLQDFAYRTSIGFGTLTVSGLLAVVVALGAVGWQAVRAALANPVESPRYE